MRPYKSLVFFALWVLFSTFNLYAYNWSETIVSGVTPIRKGHIDELRTAINQVRSQYGLGNYPWTEPNIVAGVTPIKAGHLQEMRTAIQAVCNQRGQPCNFTDPAIAPGVTPIKAIHFLELRAAVDGTPPAAFCGDTSCNGGEDCNSCPQDCGACGGCDCKNAKIEANPNPATESANPQNIYFRWGADCGAAGETFNCDVKKDGASKGWSPSCQWPGGAWDSPPRGTYLYTFHCPDPGSPVRASVQVVVNPPAGCSCGNWSDQGCGGGSCSSGQKRETRTCSPAGCASEERCVDVECCTADQCCQNYGGADPAPPGCGCNCGCDYFCQCQNYVCKNCSGYCCFGAGAKILTPQGLVPIEKLTQGTAVYSWDLKAKKLVSAKVVSFRRHDVKGFIKVTFSGGLMLDVTSEHPFYDPKGKNFRPIKEFKAGDAVLFLASPTKGRFTDLEIMAKEDRPEGKLTVYNLSVEGKLGDFLANGVLVHNKCAFDPCTTCPDGNCGNNENCASCPQDCGTCPPAPVCPDGNCNGSETCSSCPADCGTCGGGGGGGGTCPDGNCDAQEGCSSCPEDCGYCQQ